MEGVRRAGSVGCGDREGQLDSGVRRKSVDATARQDVCGGLRTAHDLQKHRYGGWDEGRSVDEEVRPVLRRKSSAMDRTQKSVRLTKEGTKLSA